MICSASRAIGTAPLELLIFAMPLIPTNAYIGPIGGSAPKISRTSWLPTTNDDPGDWWSTPEGSKTTPSCAQRIGQSTFQTSLPRRKSRSSTVSVKPSSQTYDICVVASSYAVTVVVSLPQRAQYGL